METPLYYLARALIALVQALPLTWVARLGRWGGGLAYRMDGRHRRVALANLTMCFGREQSPAQLRALAHENFRRIGENFACAVKTAAMSFEDLSPRVEFVGNARILSPPPGQPPQGIVAAIGHFGNFELYARFGQFAPAYKCATTYRGLRQPSLDRLLQALRERSGCLYFERRFDAPALKSFMNQPAIMLGLLSDQSSGNVRVPFLGQDCSTTTAPAIFALRYHCALITGICYRVGLARWRIEAGAEIPTRESGQPRSPAAIMGDVNRAFEAAVRRDPANWFWVHRRWKAASSAAGVPPASAATSSASDRTESSSPEGRRDPCRTTPLGPRRWSMSDLPPPAAQAPRRALVRGVNWLGDAVMTTPALQRLREALPSAHLTLLTHEKLADLWHHHPSLDAVMTFSAGENLWSVARRLRLGRFDTALVLPNSPRAALEVWLARVPQRIGYAQPWRSRLLTLAVAPHPGPPRMPKRSVSEVKRLIRLPGGTLPMGNGRPIHQIHDYLHLVAVLGANPDPLPPRLDITAAETRQAEDALLSKARSQAQINAPGQPLTYLGLIPGAEYGPAKRWPASSFAAVAREVSGRLRNHLWLALGGEKDWDLCDEVARLANGCVINLAGRTSLRELMALLKLCRVVLTNDTGPMHVAAALGTPVVVPFGSTSPELTGPGLPGDTRHRLLKSPAPCSPCFRRVCPIDFRCMTGISPGQAVEAVLAAVK